MATNQQQRSQDSLVNNNLHWTTKDQRFLIENYEELGTEKMSLLLNRSYKSVAQRVSELRAGGLMRQPIRRTTRRRQFNN